MLSIQPQFGVYNAVVAQLCMHSSDVQLVRILLINIFLIFN